MQRLHKDLKKKMKKNSSKETNTYLAKKLKIDSEDEIHEKYHPPSVFLNGTELLEELLNTRILTVTRSQ